MDSIDLSSDYYVLDTSAILTDTTCLQSFTGKTVVIPISVILELDRKKTKIDEVGKAARFVHKYLYNLTKKGEVTDGVLDEKNDVTIMCALEEDKDIPEGLDK